MNTHVLGTEEGGLPWQVLVRYGEGVLAPGFRPLSTPRFCTCPLWNTSAGSLRLPLGFLELQDRAQTSDSA